MSEPLLWEPNLSNSDNSAGHEEPPRKPPPGKKRGRGAVGGGDHDQVVKEGKVGGGGGGESSDHEIHIWTERERRKKMRNMFANLHALLPQLPPKVYISINI